MRVTVNYTAPVAPLATGTYTFNFDRSFGHLEDDDTLLSDLGDSLGVQDLDLVGGTVSVVSVSTVIEGVTAEAEGPVATQAPTYTPVAAAVPATPAYTPVAPVAPAVPLTTPGYNPVSSGCRSRPV